MTQKTIIILIIAALTAIAQDKPAAALKKANAAIDDAESKAAVARKAIDDAESKVRKLPQEAKEAKKVTMEATDQLAYSRMRSAQEALRVANADAQIARVRLQRAKAIWEAAAGKLTAGGCKLMLDQDEDTPYCGE